MGKMNSRVLWYTHAEATYQFGAHQIDTHQLDTVTVTPISRLVGLRWSGGGWLWQFPLAVEVTTGTQQQRLRVSNVTRDTILALYAGAMLVVLALWLFQRANGKMNRSVNQQMGRQIEGRRAR